jgi:primosomal protein N' (replication factor Y)
MASVQGSSDAVASLLASLYPAYEVLGPVPVDPPPSPAPVADGTLPEEEVRALVRASRPQGTALARALQAAQAARSARKEGGGVRVQLDPADLI